MILWSSIQRQSVSYIIRVFGRFMFMLCTHYNKNASWSVQLRYADKQKIVCFSCGHMSSSKCHQITAAPIIKTMKNDANNIFCVHYVMIRFPRRNQIIVWSSVIFSDTVAKMMEWFYEVIQDIFDKFVPKAIIRSSNNPVWLSASMPNIAKAFERGVHNQLKMIITSHIPAQQHGFLSNRCIESNFHDFIGYIHVAFECNAQVDVFYAAVKKAFSTVDQPRMMNKLKKIQ